MTYIRHRSRSVQQAVLQDLRDTLIACRWLVGTTASAVVPPAGGAPAQLTTTAADVFPLAEGSPITLLDYFPESQGEAAGPTAPNTFAMDNGRPGDAADLEMGSTAKEQPYLFNFAFYAVSDAVADAVMSDLKDRYEGRLIAGEVIPLRDYVSDPDGPPVAWLEVDSFRYARDADNVAPAEVHLFFAELTLTDVIE